MKRVYGTALNPGARRSTPELGLFSSCKPAYNISEILLFADPAALLAQSAKCECSEVR